VLVCWILFWVLDHYKVLDNVTEPMQGGLSHLARAKQFLDDPVEAARNDAALALHAHPTYMKHHRGWKDGVTWETAPKLDALFATLNKEYPAFSTMTAEEQEEILCQRYLYIVLTQ
jgi:hypothetical protein